ncbi:heme NO-binding domain-containing protein [Marinobacterium sp. AK62]|uniref:Heme NO-binding domain-containing protein n=1 Tax=Marinobacterium alkalitolerans TaxID=1542925 RepID=A0ABS3Z6N5_9GAMM|nr:heme NO-binding domain-containing protein [Marinobacterium alkalitolerans]MBP0047376.1 heme NO-binding domain-containing protein [Marinobacterium alkalitolerans]
MKGVVFNILEEMVLEEKGMEAWNEILSRTQAASGVYTSAISYPDEELFALVGTVSDYLEIPAQSVVKAFGEYMFGALAERYPVFIERCPDLFSFLDSIDSVIHVEVNKLYQNPGLPRIRCERTAEHQLLMYYFSERKLCMLAEGLTFGAARRYGDTVEIRHRQCMHDGADQCVLEVNVVA